MDVEGCEGCRQQPILMAIICGCSMLPMMLMTQIKVNLNGISHLGQSNQISLIWVPGHSDVDENEVADTLERLGSWFIFGTHVLVELLLRRTLSGAFPP